MPPRLGAIRGDAGIAKHASDRADVDNSPVTALNHAAREGLCDEEGTAQVCIEHQVPIVPSAMGLMNLLSNERPMRQAQDFERGKAGNQSACDL